MSHVVLLDDDEGFGEVLAEAKDALGATQVDAQTFSSVAAMKAWIRSVANGQVTPLPSLIVLDMEVDGVYDAGEKILVSIRKLKALRGTPVVVFSLAAEEADVKVYSAGANSIVKKPRQARHQPGALGQILKYWLDTNVHHGPSARPPTQTAAGR